MLSKCHLHISKMAFYNVAYEVCVHKLRLEVQIKDKTYDIVAMTVVLIKL